MLSFILNSYRTITSGLSEKKMFFIKSFALYKLYSLFILQQQNHIYAFLLFCWSWISSYVIKSHLFGFWRLKLISSVLVQWHMPSYPKINSTGKNSLTTNCCLFVGYKLSNPTHATRIILSRYCLICSSIDWKVPHCSHMTCLHHIASL